MLSTYLRGQFQWRHFKVPLLCLLVNSVVGRGIGRSITDCFHKRSRESSDTRKHLIPSCVTAFLAKSLCSCSGCPGQGSNNFWRILAIQICCSIQAMLILFQQHTILGSLTAVATEMSCMWSPSSHLHGSFLCQRPQKGIATLNLRRR